MAQPGAAVDTKVKDLRRTRQAFPTGIPRWSGGEGPKILLKQSFPTDAHQRLLRSLMTFLRRAWLSISTALLISSVPLLALPCEHLRSLPIQGATVTWTQPVTAGSFQPSGSDLTPFRHLPAF